MITSLSSLMRRWSPPAGYRWRRQSTISFVAFHALVPLALTPWFFSWTGVALAFVGFYLFNTVGIDVCFHRLLSHRSFKSPLWLERTLALLGVCGLQDSPTQWAATHRRHHRHTDEEQDPHSPLESVFWGHIGWLIVKEKDPHRSVLQQKYVADMLRDPFYRHIEKNTLWLWIFLGHAILFFGAGFLVGLTNDGTLAAGARVGTSLFLWGVIVRVVYSWHATWAVNSVAHLWGYRNYDTSDNSRNNWFLSLVTWGAGWHNNHHGDQRSAAHGHHRWWEFDGAYLTILALQCVGLAWDVTPRRRLHLLIDQPSAADPEVAADPTVVPFRQPDQSTTEVPAQRDRAA